jgi:signal transduction histidine kinase/DNA-binding NarL/FixJ family response regulator/HPt (histidine-containing phosphotransfer) domain-containing protein
MNLTQLLRKTSPYILLVVAAFGVMGVVGYYSANNVMKTRTEENINYIFRTVEGNIAGGLARADVQLLNSYHFIRRVLDRGTDTGQILEYMQGTSAWMRRDFNGTPGFMGLYAYIDGRFLDGIGLKPGPDWDPKTRPWYQAAQNLANGEAVTTSPYIDDRTGKPVISVVRNLYNQNGEYHGILVMDVDLIWFSEQYAKGMNLRGYGMVINQEMLVVCHPDETRLGRRLDELSYDYALTASLLKQNGSLWNRHITDLNGEQALAFFQPIYNGWYAALVMPIDAYYNDIYNIQINPLFIGIILVLLLCLIILRINAAQIRSDEISAYKSTFLAQMSHEIRTPMNTVLGMSELALREHDPSRVTDYVGGIKRAAHSLLSIINDILDISRIDAGTLRITPAPYYFASLLNVAISMIRVQVAEKPVVFTANVDAWLPNSLMGDETRIKQILINLLSNAVKYTHEGFIALDIQGALQDRKTVRFTIKVSDSGVGIRKNDMRILFENFVRLDLEQNRGIEGAGLGLVITRNLCRAMGGDVEVQSEYGKGSVFTATILQQFDDDEGIARVENALTKRVLCFEERDLYAASVMRTLETLGVPAKRCAEREEFFRELDRGGYQFAFVTANIAEETVDRIKTGFLPTNPVLLANPGEMVSSHNIPMLTMPVYATPAANVLNNRSIFDQRKQRSVRFIAPGARVLIVDDIATNVKVAEGLLSLYQPVIDSCFDGRTAVELVRKHHYDVVFLDHMMPGMDGIETASAIRALKEERFLSLPLIALTANAIFGMREMFLQNGFNDYLAKPIEMTKLDEILLRWIPGNKQVRVSGLAEPDGFSGNTAPPYRRFTGGESAEPDAAGTSGNSAPSGELAASGDLSSMGEQAAPVFAGLPPVDSTGSVPIAGVDIMEGMNLTGSSTWAMYRDILALYGQDAASRLEYLRAMPDETSLPTFITQVHALKGASASIGASAIAQMAADLQNAGKTGDLAAVQEQIGPFCRELEALITQIRAVLADSAGGAAE